MPPTTDGHHFNDLPKRFGEKDWVVVHPKSAEALRRMIKPCPGAERSGSLITLAGTLSHLRVYVDPNIDPNVVLTPAGLMPKKTPLLRLIEEVYGNEDLT